MSELSKKNLSLYNLSDEVKALDRLSEELGGEITPELEQLQDECMQLIKSKVDSFVAFTEMLEDEIELANQRIKKLKEFQNSRKNKIENMKKFAMMALNHCEQDEFRGGLGSIKKLKPLKQLEVLNEHEIPVEYIRTVPAKHEVDKMALKKAIKNGEYEGEAARLVDGAERIKLSLKSI